MAVRKSVKSAQPPRQSWEEESCRRARDPQSTARAGLDRVKRARSDGHTSVRREKKMIFSYLRAASFSVCLVVRAGVEPTDCARSDGCTISVGIQPEKKCHFRFSRCELHMPPVLGGPPDPAPAGRRNLRNLRAPSQIYRKFGALPTLHYFTRQNRHFTHFTALYTGFRPLSGLHTHVAHRPPMYLGAYHFFGTSRACCSLAWGGLPLPDRLSEHSHP